MCVRACVCVCVCGFCYNHLQAASSEHRAEADSKTAVSPVQRKESDSVEGLLNRVCGL